MHPSIKSSSSKFRCLYKRISNMLLSLGFLKNQKGFTYLCHTIYFGVVEKGQRYEIHTKLFPKVADLFQIKPKNIVRTSRRALDEAYFNDGLKKINEVIELSYLRPYERPTLKNFVSTMIEKSVFILNDLNFHSTYSVVKSEFITPIKQWFSSDVPDYEVREMFMRAANA